MNGLIEEWYIGLVGKPEVSFAKVDALKHIQDVLCTPGCWTAVCCYLIREHVQYSFVCKRNVLKWRAISGCLITRIKLRLCEQRSVLRKTYIVYSSCETVTLDIDKMDNCFDVWCKKWWSDNITYQIFDKRIYIYIYRWTCIYNTYVYVGTLTFFCKQ